MTVSLIGGPQDGAYITLRTKWLPDRIFVEREPTQKECTPYSEHVCKVFIAAYYLQGGKYHFFGYGECSQ